MRAHQRLHVVAFDYGVKRNILRMLADRGGRMTVVPAQTTAEEVLALEPDGVFLSNGPGDPEPCDYAIEAIRALVCAGTTVMRQPRSASMRRMLRLTPKSYATTCRRWCARMT